MNMADLLDELKCYVTPDDALDADQLLENKKGLSDKVIILESEMENFVNCLKKIKQIHNQCSTKRCKCCYKVYSTEDELGIHNVKHLAIELPHFNVTNHTCPLCEKYFVSPEACLRHIADNCEGNLKKKSQSTPVQISKKLVNVLKFDNEHINFRLNGQSVQCEPEKPLPCYMCNGKFARYDQVWYHCITKHDLRAIKKHWLPKRRRMCPLCNYVAIVQNSFVKHLRIRHLRCDKCSRKFDRLQNFVSHLVSCGGDLNNPLLPCVLSKEGVRYSEYIEHLTSCDNSCAQQTQLVTFDENCYQVVCELCIEPLEVYFLDTHISDGHCSFGEDTDSEDFAADNDSGILHPALEWNQQLYQFCNAEATFDKLVDFLNSGTINNANDSTILINNDEKELTGIFNKLIIDKNVSVPSACSSKTALSLHHPNDAGESENSKSSKLPLFSSDVKVDCLNNITNSLNVEKFNGLSERDTVIDCDEKQEDDVKKKHVLHNKENKLRVSVGNAEKKIPEQSPMIEQQDITVTAAVITTTATIQAHLSYTSDCIDKRSRPVKNDKITDEISTSILLRRCPMKRSAVSCLNDSRIVTMVKKVKSMIKMG